MEKNHWKLLLSLVSLVGMLAFVSYLPYFLPKTPEKFSDIKMTLKQNPQEVVDWLRNTLHQKLSLSDSWIISSKVIRQNEISLRLEHKILDQFVYFDVSLAEINPRNDSSVELAGILIDEKGKQSFFRTILKPFETGSRVSFDVVKSDYSPTELSLMYRHVQSARLR